MVTGGAGFLGSHLCERLLSRGCRVVCVDNYLTGRPANIASPYYYRYPTTGMLAVRDRKSKSKVQIATHNQETHIEFRIPWTDIDATPNANSNLLLNIATFPNPDSTTPAYISSPALIGGAPAYHPMYYERVLLTP